MKKILNIDQKTSSLNFLRGQNQIFILPYIFNAICISFITLILPISICAQTIYPQKDPNYRAPLETSTQEVIVEMDPNNPPAPFNYHSEVTTPKRYPANTAFNEETHGSGLLTPILLIILFPLFFWLMIAKKIKKDEAEGEILRENLKMKNDVQHKIVEIKKYKNQNEDSIPKESKDQKNDWKKSS